MTLGHSDRSNGSANPWTAGWRAHLACIAWVVFAGAVVGGLCRAASSMWPAYVLFVPVLLVALWIILRLHRGRDA